MIECIIYLSLIIVSFTVGYWYYSKKLKLIIGYIQHKYFYKRLYKKIKITIEDSNPLLIFIIETNILINAYEKEAEEEFLHGIIKLYEDFHGDDVIGEYIQ